MRKSPPTARRRKMTRRTGRPDACSTPPPFARRMAWGAGSSYPLGLPPFPAIAWLPRTWRRRFVLEVIALAKQFDAIVVGARCAGSPIAMLLARKGYKVLVLDRAKFPSDTISTHLIHPPGVASLK